MANTSVAEKFRSMEYGAAPEDPANSLRWLDEHRRRFGHYIGGKWKPPAQGRYFETTDPSTGEKIADIAQGSAADVNAAVKAARAALPRWQALTPHARARFLYALARQVQKHSRRLAVLETLDNGKPIRESRDIDIPLVARHFYYHAGWAQLLEREFPGHSACGVVGQIIPWNFPLLMVAWKVAPALAAGNTVVLKPAEFTPLTALAFAELCEEVGLPPGVVNVVTGDGTTGAALVAHPDVDKIAFTGSTEVGRAIRRATADSHKKLSLELGGKSPFVVFEDADLDSAVEGLVDGIWLNQGQVCCAGSRLLMHESIAASLIKKLQARMSALRVGAPLDKTTDIGAIVAPVQLERITGLVAQGVAEGASCWQPDLTLPTKGLYYPPTLFTNVHPTLRRGADRDLRASARGDDFPYPGRGRGARQQHRLWTRGQRLERERQCRSAGGRADQGGCGVGQQHEPVRRGVRFRWLPGERVRPGGRTRGNARVPRADVAAQGPAAAGTRDVGVVNGGRSGADAATLIDRTVKLYIGGKQVRPDSGYSLECRSRQRGAARAGAAREPQGHPQRGRGGETRAAVERRHDAPARPGSLLCRGEPHAARRGGRRTSCRGGRQQAGGR